MFFKAFKTFHTSVIFFFLMTFRSYENLNNGIVTLTD